MQNSQLSIPSSSEVIQYVEPKPVESKISAYVGALTQKGLIQQVSRIKNAYPQLPAVWHLEFRNAIQRHGFTDERLQDAVNYVIENCRYLQPLIADFIGFDRTIVLRDYNWMVKNSNETVSMWDYYVCITLNGVECYVSKLDAARFPHLCVRKK
jgi:hypothetical protein